MSTEVPRQSFTKNVPKKSKNLLLPFFKILWKKAYKNLNKAATAFPSIFWTFTKISLPHHHHHHHQHLCAVQLEKHVQCLHQLFSQRTTCKSLPALFSVELQPKRLSVIASPSVDFVKWRNTTTPELTKDFDHRIISIPSVDFVIRHATTTFLN